MPGARFPNPTQKPHPEARIPHPEWKKPRLLRLRNRQNPKHWLPKGRCAPDSVTRRMTSGRTEVRKQSSRRLQSAHIEMVDSGRYGNILELEIDALDPLDFEFELLAHERIH